MRKPYHKCKLCGKDIWGKEYCKVCLGLIIKGKNNPFFGKHHTNKTKKQMKLHHADVSGKNNPFYIHGETLIKTYCKICNRLLGKNAFYYEIELCKSCSKKEQFKDPRKHPRFGTKASNGKKIQYKNNYMRSNWEVLYAKYLDKNNIKWLYESKTFDLGNTTYTPDFYLPETNEYIEIKGWWRDIFKIKFNIFKRQYSQIKIKVLMKPELQKLGIL
jgi:hypothetical protein